MTRSSYRIPELNIRFILALSVFLQFACSKIENASVSPKTNDAVVDSSDHPQETNQLSTLSRGIAVIAKNASAAVVMISSERMMSPADLSSMETLDFLKKHKGLELEMPRTINGMGSGFFIDMEKGLIVTNNHVIEGADLLHLKLANMKSYDAKVLARDPRTDLAVLKIKDEKFDRSGLKTLNFDKTSNLQPGEFVLALGAPFGLEASVSFGVVSAVNRGNLNITELGDFIQTDAAINPGNSGGPLLNVEGQVVGISTAIYSQSGVYNGVGFAIPSKLVNRVVDNLVDTGRVDRGYIGVRLRPPHTRGSVEAITFEAEGAVIAMVTEKSPAALAGIKAGDVIVAVNQKPVGTPVDLTNTIGMLEPGSKVDVEFKRGKERQRVSMRLEPYPEVKRFPEALSGR
ncbi:MAG: PDZ domain-containing protein [Proteobacteria bacterium]|nr:MAG: PDZ domain-containing protein [Pseudomonadota bacterium]